MGYVSALLSFAAALPVGCQATVFAGGFAKYPGYEGILEVTGAVAIVASASDGWQELMWDLVGLDAACTSGAADAITNGCGIHVHSGTSCASAGEVGGHHYDSSEDPWLVIRYTSDASNRSVGSAVVATGVALSDLAGRAFVVHDLSGGRVACGVLEASANVGTSALTPYPGYAGKLAVTGTVNMFMAGGTAQVMTWDLTGLDVACSSMGAADGITNGCGIHVHAGTSCDAHEDVGGHYYDAGMAADPWGTVVYVADSLGRSTGTVAVDTGKSLADMAGRAFVVHELASGGRVACGILGESNTLAASGFGGYPGYSGSLAVSGSVTITATGSENEQLVSWDLSGLDASCAAGAAEGIANGCGIHVHEGTTCASADLVGGHLFSTLEDPWLSVVYESDGSGRSMGSATVNTGMAISDLAGRAFVVHELASGGRVACGILFPPAPSPPPTGGQAIVFANTFAKYPGYSGNLEVSGTVSLVASPTEGIQMLLWDLSGLDTACTSGAADGITNGCGIHVHSGTSCAEASEVGGHLFGTAEDPWLVVTYVSNGAGRSVGSSHVATGHSISDFSGRAFVVHELTGGGRIACAVLGTAASVESSELSPYPGYSGNMAVSGTVTMSMAGSTTQVLTWDLEGLDAACSSMGAADGITNGCGIHVHAGTSCDAHEDVGGHYYDAVMSADPWATVVYVADSSGRSRGTATLETGRPLADMVGRAFVVHELASGGRVACGILGDSGLARAPTFSAYPGYSGGLTVGGMVSITSTGAGDEQLLMWDLSGLDTSCTAGAADGVTNGCGIHVHSGTTCASADLVGGHLFGEGMAADPWAEVRYVADSSGRSVGRASLVTGLNISDLAGRAFVVHELASGGRVACGILFAATSMDTTTFSRYPGYSGDLAVQGRVSLEVAGRTSQKVKWDLTGMDARCSKPDSGTGVVHGCGIHVCSGSTCEDLSRMGDHVYHDSMSHDPWQHVRYVVDSSGASKGTATVETGMQLSDLAGQAYVEIHDMVTGEKVACSVLEIAQTRRSMATTTQALLATQAPTPDAEEPTSVAERNSRARLVIIGAPVVMTMVSFLAA